MASKDHLELLFLCQCFNSGSNIGRTAQALNLSLDAISRARISQLVKERRGLNAQDDSGWTALMAATCYDHADIVQELLEAGADPDIQDKQGLTAMHYAAERKFFRILVLLARSRANVNATSCVGDSPLVFAARGNDLHLVRQLLVFGAHDAHTALATAVMFGHTDVAQLLQVHCRIMHYMSVVAVSCFVRTQHGCPLPCNVWTPATALAASYVQFDVVSSSSMGALQQRRLLMKQRQRLLCLARGSLLRVLIARLCLGRMYKPQRLAAAMAGRCIASLPRRLMCIHHLEEANGDASEDEEPVGRWAANPTACALM